MTTKASTRTSGKFWTPVDKEMLKDMTTDYVVSDLSLMKISKKYKINMSAVRKISAKHKWMDKRKKFAEKIVTKAIEDTKERFHRISGDVSAVFFKQAKYIKRRLSLIEDGQPVPKDLMQEAIMLHELVQKDLMKIKELDKNQHPSTIQVESSMPSVVDLMDYKPKNTQAPVELKEDVETQVVEEDKETPQIDIDAPDDPLGDK